MCMHVHAEHLCTKGSATIMYYINSAIMSHILWNLSIITYPIQQLPDLTRKATFTTVTCAANLVSQHHSTPSPPAGSSGYSGLTANGGGVS